VRALLGWVPGCRWAGSVVGEALEPWCSVSRSAKVLGMRLRLGLRPWACEVRGTRASQYGAAEPVKSGQSSRLAQRRG